MFFFKLFTALALATYSTSNPTESKHECDGKTPCYKPLDYPPDEKSGAGNSEHHRPERSVGSSEELCEQTSKMIPPYNVNNADLLYPVLKEYFTHEVLQTYCKNEGASCFDSSGAGYIPTRCETTKNSKFLTFTIKTNETLTVATMVKTGCTCKFV